jgi:hypothetical protein
MDWLDSLELDPHTMATYRGQAEKWIYPKIGATKLAEFKATDAAVTSAPAAVNAERLRSKRPVSTLRTMRRYHAKPRRPHCGPRARISFALLLAVSPS